jgi:hypothetical protein
VSIDVHGKKFCIKFDKNGFGKEAAVAQQYIE